MPKPSPSRREWIAGAAGAAVVAGAARGDDEPPAATRPDTRPDTRPATGPATKPAETPDDAQIDAAADLVGRTFTAAHKAQMRGVLRRRRAVLQDLRELDLPPGLEPALDFDPVLPGMAPDVPDDYTAPTAPPPDFGGVEELAFATVPQLAAALAAGRVTSVELTRMYLGRLERFGPRLNCVVNLTPDLALRQAGRADDERRAGTVRSPLHGVPYGLKDLLATAGVPTTYGVSPYETQIFDFDATVVKRLEDAGAVLVAKLSLGELAMGDVWFGGTTRNPWNPDEGSSGSSAGSAAAVAAGLVGFALGTETQGSIISPCVRCGTFGLRPTYGRVPRTGAMPLVRSMDKVGVIGRGVSDLTLALHAIAGPDGHDPTCRPVPISYTGDLAGVRVGYDAAAFEKHADYADVLDLARQTIGDLVPVALPADPRLGSATSTIIDVEGAEAFVELTQAGGLDELVQQDDWNWPNAFRRAAFVPAVEYVRTNRLRRQFMHDLAAATAGVDVYLTVPLTQPNLTLTNLAGYPACALRQGMRDGRPRTLELVARPYQEAALLATAAALEKAATPATWPRLG